MPITEEDWITVERGFRNRFPHAIGAIDGKHVVLQAPINSGSDYFDYKKKTFSIVLLALVDSNYCFMFANIGYQGTSYNPPGTFDTYFGDTLIRNGAWRDNISDNPALQNMRRVPRRPPRNAVEIRKEFASSFHH
ncbi:hypothetical protein NQ318_007054 [Aromia moschata]|uniref:DDE Tnp4 domain-containing protein n=1 Tax=Aromia moschata TaxID=1265417 RepID=A0AAV8XD27_9CUCU|nr:hypothetical protein NQ318_007054 [Aromia moschata]